MKKEVISLPEIRLICLKERTSNQEEMSGNSKIGPCIAQYFGHDMASQIPHRKHPGRTFAAYGDYESDYKGPYTYYLGEEVISFEEAPPPFIPHLIPAQTYQKFTLSRGPIPEVVIQGWQQIWAMSERDLGGKRAYETDFEIYEHNAYNPQEPFVTIYVGIKGAS